MPNYEPENFNLETTTLWSFPQRGEWATHKGDYRGNFAPQIPRNLILKYTQEGELVLDPMVGGGTTLIEARLLNRNAIGIDLNPTAVALTQERLRFPVENKSTQRVYEGDARDLRPWVEAESIDLLLTHPPYANIIRYSQGKLAADFSNIASINKFCQELSKAIAEFYRVLKPNRYCAILIGDLRRARHYVPLAYRVMNCFLRQGFILKEDIIKVQHNCKTTNMTWRSGAAGYDFYLIAHEHLFVFRKPAPDEDLSRFRDSMEVD